MDNVSIILAFSAGLLSFLSPCVLHLFIWGTALILIIIAVFVTNDYGKSNGDTTTQSSATTSKNTDFTYFHLMKLTKDIFEFSLVNAIFTAIYKQ